MDNFKIFDMIQENDDPHMGKCALLRPIRKNIKDLHRRLIFLEDKSLIEHIDTDGEFIVSAGKYEIDVWDMFEGTHVRKLIGHEGPIVGLKLQMIGMQETGPIDRIIISASADGAIIQWSVQTGVMLRKFVTNSTLTCMTVLNKLFAVTGNNKGQLELYHLSSGTKQISVQAHDDPIDALLVNKDYICTTVSDRRNLKIWIYNETIKCIYELEEYKTKFNAFAIYDNILILGDALSQKLHFLFFKRREKFIVELQQSGGEVQQINVANNYITCTTIDETGMIYLHMPEFSVPEFSDKMKPSTENVKTEETSRWKIPGMRYVFAVTGFLGFFTIYAIRVNINVAIVAMVNNTAVYQNNNKTESYECKVTPPPFVGNSTIYDEISKNGEFIWSPKLQSVVIGAFYYGYCISQIPGGRIAEIFSGKWVFGIGTVITALLTLLTPLAARYSVILLIIIRALEGFAQGVTMPAMHSMLGRWIPDSEKAFISTLVYCGINVGTVVTMPLSGILCNSEVFGGWPSAFYVIGIWGCFWFLLWCFLVSDTPRNHPFITKKELKYITSQQRIDLNGELPPIPWRKILTSVPVWAIIIAQIGSDWCFYTLVNDLPTFFSTILHLNIEKNGFLSAFPHLLQTFLGLGVAFTSDYLIKKGCVSTNFMRKFCNSVSGFGPALALVGVCLAGCDVTLNVVFFTLSLAVGGFCYSGYMLSHLDLSPEYAGTLMGIANTISNLTGFLAPLVVGALTEEYQTLHQWRIVFGIVIVLLILTNLFFIFFSSVRKQEWACVPEEKCNLLSSTKLSPENNLNYNSIQC